MSGYDGVQIRPDQRVQKTAPPDQINTLSHGLHPGGFINPYEAPSTMTEYQSKFCTFKLTTQEQLEVSRFERDRVLGLMERLYTVQQRSYTNPHDSLYPVIGTKTVELQLDRSREAEMKYFKMNGRTEYQAIYDGKEFEEIV